VAGKTVWSHMASYVDIDVLTTTLYTEPPVYEKLTKCPNFTWYLPDFLEGGVNCPALFPRLLRLWSVTSPYHGLAIQLVSGDWQEPIQCRYEAGLSNTHEDDHVDVNFSSPRGVARISVWGGTGRAPKPRESRRQRWRGAWGAGKGCFPSHWVGVWGGDSPENFLNFYIKMVSCRAFWVASN